MSRIDQTFIKILKTSIPKHISATEEIASVLGINYDAAYRRLNGKVPFNLEESVKLSKTFDISLNKLFEIGEKNSYLIKESKPINNINDFINYLRNFDKELKPLANNKDASILFSARELPMFYFFHQPILIKFKAFVWFSILNVTPVNKRILYKDFIVTDTMINAATSLGKTYNNINKTEMWSFGAINNFLQQILYLHEMNQITLKDAQEICDAIIIEIKKVENDTLFKSEEKQVAFNLYSNELLMMNNSMILQYKDKLQFGYPYALLKFFLINNQKACKAQKEYILEQTRHATCITDTSIKDHTTFFNHKYAKINRVLEVIENKENKPTFL